MAAAAFALVLVAAAAESITIGLPAGPATLQFAAGDDLDAMADAFAREWGLEGGEGCTSLDLPPSQTTWTNFAFVSVGVLSGLLIGQTAQTERAQVSGNRAVTACSQRRHSVVTAPSRGAAAPGAAQAAQTV